MQARLVILAIVAAQFNSLAWGGFSTPAEAESCCCASAAECGCGCDPAQHQPASGEQQKENAPQGACMCGVPDAPLPNAPDVRMAAPQVSIHRGALRDLTRPASNSLLAHALTIVFEHPPDELDSLRCIVLLI